MPNPLSAPLNTRFDGWVMIHEYSEGVLLMTEITAIDYDRQSPGLSVPLCSGTHEVERSSLYELVNPNEVEYLCGTCMLKLWDGRQVGSYLMGALPAN